MNRIAAVVTLALLSMVCVDSIAQTTSSVIDRSPTVAARTDDLGCERFNDAVQQYSSVRTRIQTEVPPLRVTTDVAELRSRSNALALAIQRARPRAGQGEFFDAGCARAISARFAQALEGFDVNEFLTSLKDEPADVRPPQVHMRYPAAASMATMPANLLNVLPELPPIVEYRLVGRYLILRDIDAALVLDYFADAVPTSPRRGNVAR
jgi:hypothetical protein